MTPRPISTALLSTSAWELPNCWHFAPPVLGDMSHPWQQAKFAGAKEKTVEMAHLYKALADYSRIDFVNAGDSITTDGSDGIHLSAQNNVDLGTAIAEQVKQMTAGSA